MLNFQKRFVKMVAGTLSAVMISYAFVPAAAFAAHHHAPPRPLHRQSRSYQHLRYYRPVYYQPHYYRPVYHQLPRPYRHPHYYYDRWTKHDTAAVAGLAALIGLLVLAKQKHRDAAPSVVTEATPVGQNISGVYHNSGNSQVVAPEFAVQVLNLVNAERAKVGSRPLCLSNDLMNAAAVRAVEITRRFAHERPDGSSCFTLLRDRNHYLGENIAAGSATPEAVVDQWMHSKGHRENMLDKRFKELGIGHCYKEGSSYGHYWVQMFRG